MLTRETVEKVAHLSRLSFSEDELDKQQYQLNLIIEMMDQLTNIDTDDVLPLNHVTDLENIWRDDLVDASMSKTDVLANAPEESEGMFQVPKIV